MMTPCNSFRRLLRSFLRFELGHFAFTPVLYGRLLLVAHTDRNNLTRIISARAVTRREQRIYEESL
jgi:hypothetical protein